MTPKHKTFSHGYKFNNFEGQPEAKLIKVALPSVVTIPLRQGFGAEVSALVEIGDKVKAGQIIGRDDNSVSSPVHSSVDGKVVAEKQINYLGAETAAVVIETESGDGFQVLEGHSKDWQELPAGKIGELIYLSGISSSGKGGIPTGFKSSVLEPGEVKNVIVQGIASEVHNPSLEVILKGDRLSHFTEGLKILQKLMGQAKFHLAFDISQQRTIAKASQLMPGNKQIDVFTVPTKYPLACDEVLAPLLLERKWLGGYSAASIGVVVLDIQAVLGVYDAVVCGKPAIEKIVALCGPGFKENKHAMVRIGTPLEDIIKERTKSGKDLRFVENSSITGATLRDMSLPINRTFNCIIALIEGNEKEFLSFMLPGAKKDSYCHVFLSTLFEKMTKIKKGCDTNLHGEVRPCLSCGFCEDVCPVDLLPHLIFHQVKNNVIDEKLINYKIFDCVECNLCSYVCPSKIALGQSIKDGKGKLQDEGFACPKPDLPLERKVSL